LVSSGARSSFRCRKVGGVAFNMKDHVAGVIMYNCIGVCSAIVEEVGESIKCGGGAIGLLRGKGANGSEHGGVDGARIEEQSA